MTVALIIVVVYVAGGAITLYATASEWRDERNRQASRRLLYGIPLDPDALARAARPVLASPFWPALLVYVLAICAAGAWAETRTSIRNLWNDAFPPKKEAE